MQGIPQVETRLDDVRAVMDAVGSRRAAIMGVSEGGLMTALFAATYPDRTAAAILYGTAATLIKRDDYPWARTREQQLLQPSIVHHAGETVARDEKYVADFHFAGIHVGLHFFARANAARNDVAVGMVPRLLGRQESSVDLFLNV